MTVISASASLSSISASASFANQTVQGGVAPSGILYQRPPLTGQTTSYANYDDGWNLANNVYDYTRPANPLTVAELDHDQATASNAFVTLKENNAFGNTNRFTDDAGGQTYSNDYVIDHYTGLGWYRLVITNDTWATLLTTAQASTAASFSDWRVPNANELLSIVRLEGYSVGTALLNYSPFNLSSTVYFATSSTVIASTDNYWAHHMNNIFSGGLHEWLGKTTPNGRLMICRNHYS